MGFDREKYAIRNGKRQITERIELSNLEKIKTLGAKETSQYLRILQADTIKQVEIKEKKFLKYLGVCVWGSLWCNG